MVRLPQANSFKRKKIYARAFEHVQSHENGCTIPGHLVSNED
jgi:hypothetical protein